MVVGHGTAVGDGPRERAIGPTDVEPPSPGEIVLLRRPFRSLVLVVVLAAVLTYVGAVTLVQGTRSTPESVSSRPARPVAEPSNGGVPTGGREQMAATVRRLQASVKQRPESSEGWAQLGAAYVQQARLTADPMLYPKAKGALERSMALKGRDNFEAALGMGALANAQHDFAAGEAWGRDAERLNPYNPNVYAVLNDALTQLGRYPEANIAAQRMLELRPGVPSLTRASYGFEQHGDNASARFALERALALAATPADVAFCRYHLGELSFNEGDPRGAFREHALGLDADPTYTPLLAGRAKAHGALGQFTDAVRDYTQVIGRVPLPEYVIELAELQASLGRHDEARRLFELVRVELRLFADNGAPDDLTAAQFEADHGDPRRAVHHAEAEWSRRRSVLVADALAWALHRTGRDVEALEHAEMAASLGWRNATFFFHKGMIEASLGRTDAARADLAEALRINPTFHPIKSKVAQTTLEGIGAGN